MKNEGHARVRPCAGALVTPNAHAHAPAHGRTISFQMFYASTNLTKQGSLAVAAALGALLLAGACRSYPERIDAWPIYYRENIGSTKQTDIVWPIGGIYKSPEREASGAWPFVTFYSDKSPDRVRNATHGVYPIYIHRDTVVGKKTWILPLYYRTRRLTAEGEDEIDTRIFPILWWGKVNGEKYFAFFPFYGTMKNRFARDEIFFVLFPIYSRSKLEGHTANNVLFPLIAWTYGGNRESSRALPFYSRYQRRDEPEIWSILWPFFHFTVSKGDEGKPRSMFYFFPFYGYDNTPKRQSWTALWPFFSFAKEPEKGYYSWMGPWPLLRLQKDKDLSRTQVWPFYGHLQEKGMTFTYYLYPVYRHRHKDAERVAQREWSVLLVMNHKVYTDKIEKTHEVRGMFWPLYRYFRKKDGSKQFYMFNPFFWLDERGFERNYSRFFRIFEYVDDKEYDETSYRFVWRLIRYDRYKKYRTFNFLGPLFRYEHEPGMLRQYSLLSGLLTVGSRGGSGVFKFLYVPFASGKEPVRTKDKVIELGDTP